MTKRDDPEGRIVKAYRVTDIAGHPTQVLEDLRSIRATSAR